MITANPTDRGSSFRMLLALFTRKKCFIITVNWPVGLRSWKPATNSSPDVSASRMARPSAAKTRRLLSYVSLVSYPFAAVDRGMTRKHLRTFATCSYCRSHCAQVQRRYVESLGTFLSWLCTCLGIRFSFVIFAVTTGIFSRFTFSNRKHYCSLYHLSLL